jgi:hypothetical protein
MKRHTDLLRLVYDMRQYQKRYFKTRSSLALDEARKQEKKVDEAIEKEIPKVKEEQLKLL